jgi:hypothetical protein
MGLAFKIVTAFILLNFVSADFQLTIALTSLTVNGKLPNGDTCSPFLNLGVNCFPRPKICIEPLEYATDDMDQCVIGSYIDLGVGNNTNEITFNANAYYGGWYNPSTYNFFGDFTGFSVKMIIWNADGTNYQEIDRHQWNLTNSDPTPVTETGDQITSFKFEWSVQVITQPTALPTISTTAASGGSTAAPPLLTDCKSITTASTQLIDIGGASVSVYCDGKGGTAIQRRIDGTGAFDSMEISDYKPFFGDATKNYWLGLDNIHTFTTGSTAYTAVITTCCGTTPLVENYDTFTVGDATSNYLLTVTAASNTYQLMKTGINTGKTDNNSPFSTYTNWNLNGVDAGICASAKGAGGWWFGSCENNLNGHYYAVTDGVDATTFAFNATLHFGDTGAGISYPVGISFGKTQIALYQKTTFRNIDINAAAQDFCA